MGQKDFQNILGQYMKTYVDDMLVKSIIGELHVSDPWEAYYNTCVCTTFDQPLQMHIRGKNDLFFGFMESECQIEAKPDKFEGDRRNKVTDIPQRSPMPERSTNCITSLPIQGKWLSPSII